MDAVMSGGATPHSVSGSSTQRKYINAFNQQLVCKWPDRKRQAWNNRLSDVNTFLYYFKPPGERQLKGPFSEDEAKKFEQRALQFLTKAWPLNHRTWGLFSLSMPNRTGEDCQQYAKSRNLHHKDDYPLKATVNCLSFHKDQTQAIWTSDIVVKISEKVDAWLIESPPPVDGQKQHAVNKLGNSSVTPSTLGWGSSSSGGTAKTNTTSSRVRRQLPATWTAPTGLVQGKENNRDDFTFSPIVFPTTTTLKASESNKTPVPNYYQQQQPLTLLPLVVPQPEPVQKKKNQNTIKPANKKKPPPPVASEAGNIKKITKEKKKKEQTVVGMKRPLDFEDDSDDDFMPGTLKPVGGYRPVAPKPTKPPAPQPKQEKQRKPKRAKAGMFLATTSSAAGADEFSTSGTDRITVIRLQADKKDLPGWAPRIVAPYQPPRLALERNNNSNSGRVARVETCSDLSTYAMARLGDGYLGVVINIPLVDSTTKGAMTSTQLAALPIEQLVAPDAMICVWASKNRISEVLKVMSTSWGCKYVENLTWIELEANGHIAGASSEYYKNSHKTLIMGRRGSGELELRHQRTVDVLVSPSLGKYRYPDEVRVMMETLLPEPKDSGSKARFVDIGMIDERGPLPAPREGWVGLLQTVSSE